MMEVGHDEITEMLNVLLEVENVSEMSDGEASGGSAVYFTDAGVQTDGPNECCALAEIELFDRHFLSFWDYCGKQWHVEFICNFIPHKFVKL